MSSAHINHVKTLRINQKSYPRSNHLRKIMSLFRVAELFLFLVMVSRFVFQLPLALKISHEYFHELTVMFISPCFVFIVGNAIIIILYIKSRGSLTQSSPPSHDAKAEACVPGHITEKQEKQHITPEEKTSDGFLSLGCEIYHQSNKNNWSELRRRRLEHVSECFGCCNDTDYCANCSEDDMTNEEFNEAIEAFIAKQQKLLREEECSE